MSSDQVGRRVSGGVVGFGGPPRGDRNDYPSKRRGARVFAWQLRDGLRGRVWSVDH